MTSSNRHVKPRDGGNDDRALTTLAAVVAVVGLAIGVLLHLEEIGRWRNDSATVDLTLVRSDDFAASGLPGGSAEWIEIPGAGLVPAPGARARLEIPVPSPPAGRALLVALDLEEGPNTEVQVLATLDGGTTERLVHRGRAESEVVVLSPSLPEGASVRLAIVARRAPEATAPGSAGAVVRAVEIYAGDVPVLPPLPSILAPGVLAILAFLLVWLHTGSAAPSAGAGLVASVLAGTLLQVAPDLADGPLAWIAAVLAGTALPLAARRRERAGAGALAALAGIAYWALIVRWNVLGPMLVLDLEPDSADFLGQAVGLGWIYSTGYREPFFVWVLKLATWLVGPGHATPRLVSVVLSIALLLVTYRLAARLFDRPVGLLAALSVAAGGYLVDQSVRGLRFELYAIEILLLLGLVLRDPATRTWRTDLSAGLLAAAILLTRLSSLGFVAVALAAIFRRGEARRPRRLALLIVPSLVLLAPHFFHSYRTFGDPMDAVNRHVRYYRNREFAGAPGRPTWEQVQEDPYGGEPATTFTYLFRDHTPRQLLAYTLTGLDQILVGRHARQRYFAGDRFRQLLCLAGLFLFLFHPRGRLVLVAIVLALGPLPFLVAAQREFDLRLVYHVAPLLEVAMAWAALLPLRVLGSRED